MIFNIFVLTISMNDYEILDYVIYFIPMTFINMIIALTINDIDIISLQDQIKTYIPYINI